MENFKEILRKRLSLQYRGKNMIGSIAMNEIKSYLNIKKIDTQTQNEILTWYVKYEKLFIKAIDQRLKIQIFREKLKIIKSINEKFKEIGYKTEIKDIILK